MNRRALERFGGDYTSVNDNLMIPGTLEAMLEECQGSLFGWECYPSIIDKAAMIAWRIIKGHLFRDGNKRTGLQACLVTLQTNGYDLPINEAVRDAILSVAKGDVSLDDFTEWLAHTAVQL
jgi:death-on-curing protein